jgi:CheY-like chemotaxis protein
MSLSKKILLVEDNPDDVELTIRAFKKNNLTEEIIVKHDGREALDYFFGANGMAKQKIKEVPALVLLDLKLPIISGIEVLKKIKGNERTKSIPVVILTSSREYSDLRECYAIGCNSYVRKPIDFNEFANTVRQMGIYWLSINEFPDQSL